MKFYQIILIVCLISSTFSQFTNIQNFKELQHIKDQIEQNETQTLNNPLFQINDNKLSEQIVDLLIEEEEQKQQEEVKEIEIQNTISEETQTEVPQETSEVKENLETQETQPSETEENHFGKKGGKKGKKGHKKQISTTEEEFMKENGERSEKYDKKQKKHDKKGKKHSESEKGSHSESESESEQLQDESVQLQEGQKYHHEKKEHHKKKHMKKFKIGIIFSVIFFFIIFAVLIRRCRKLRKIRKQQKRERVNQQRTASSSQQGFSPAQLVHSQQVMSNSQLYQVIDANGQPQIIMGIPVNQLQSYPQNFNFNQQHQQQQQLQQIQQVQIPVQNQIPIYQGYVQNTQNQQGVVLQPRYPNINYVQNNLNDYQALDMSDKEQSQSRYPEL